MTSRPRRSLALTIAGSLAAAVAIAIAPAPTIGRAAAAAPQPAFINYQSPSDYVGHGGEPTLGVNLKTGKVFLQATLKTARITFDSKKPPAATWQDVAPVETSTASLDSILYTDPVTGRTFVDQLTVACSLMAYTDDDGASWTPSTHPCEVPPGADHQTVGSGPYVPPLTSPVYPDAVYYCSQDVVGAVCALSTDGGLNFGAGALLYTADQCFGLHGHIRTGPDGAAYVPVWGCSTDPTAAWCALITAASDPRCHHAVTVSRDNGLTWTVKTIPDSGVQDTGNSDPSIAAGPKNTLYYGFIQRDGHPMVTTSKDDGTTWTKSIDLGAPLGIERAHFPDAIAGDDNRAAISWLGSTTPGEDQDPKWTGTWYLYVSFTYDGGKTWTTVNATPNDPVQRHCFQVDGGNCPNRNLLDFNDIVVDAEGRVLIAYTDGCTGDCEKNVNSGKKSMDPALLRQSCGLGLYAAKDPGFDDRCIGAVAAAAASPLPSPVSVSAGAPSPAPPRMPLPSTRAAAGGLTSAGVELLGGLVLLGVLARRRQRSARR